MAQDPPAGLAREHGVNKAYEEAAPMAPFQIEVRGGDLPHIMADAEAALIGSGENPRVTWRDGSFHVLPTIYQRAGRLCRVARIETKVTWRGASVPAKSLTIIEVELDWLVPEMTRVARFTRFDRRTGKERFIDAPREVAAGLLANVGAWKFPTLAAIIEAPTLRPDGSVVDELGYDAQTGILFDAAGTGFGEIPVSPSIEEALEAVEVFENLLAGFPFHDAGEDGAQGRNSVSFAVAVAAVITALVRPSLRTAPLFAFTAPTMSTGKSLLVDVVAMIATGREAPVMTFSADPQEERKRLLALLLKGMPLISLDNVEVPLESDALCSVLTQPSFSDRVLGASRSVEVPTSATFCATGNNLQLKGDLATRALQCRLDSRLEEPDERSFNVDLYSEVPKRRSELVRAALTIPRAYIAAGRPDLQLAPFGRFEMWAAMVRAPLVWLGLADPCASRRTIAKSDPTASELRRLLTAWEACFGSAPTTVATAVEITQMEGTEATELKEAMASFVEHGGKINGRRLGRFIAKYQGRILNGLSFSAHGDSRTGMAWSVNHC
jgi:hypothetical protein